MRISVLTMILLLAVSSLLCAGSALDITSQEAKKIISTRKGVYMLDVRTPQERAQGFIPNSTLIPIYEIERRIAEIPKDRPVIVYCAVGSRSRPVAQALAGQGYREVYNMRDGIMGWYRNGYQIQR